MLRSALIHKLADEMTKSEAINLIEGANLTLDNPQKWVDLGCGNGLFSYALADLLLWGSEILMVDKINQAPINSRVSGVHLNFLQADFTDESLPSENLDGILMANSLHFVKEKRPFLQKLREYLSQNGRLIIIEYNTEQANPWIPFPIPLQHLERLVIEAEYTSLRKIGERPSRFGHKNMYACEVGF